MNRTRHLSNDECVRASTLLEEGRSMRYVANLLGVNHSTISRMARRLRETGTHHRRRGQGRRRATNQIDERFLRQQVLRNRKCTSRELSNQLETVRNVRISALTVRRRLKEAGLASRRPASAPLLTADHKTRRLRFARDHAQWTVDDWKRVLFTDETRVSLKSPDGRDRVWRRPGERFSECAISQKEPFGGGSKMFWGGICFEARTELVPIRARSMNAEFYLENIIQDHVMPFAPFIGDTFLLMHDNARPHIARTVSDYLNEINMQIVEWPPRSPDLNPIEHLWDVLKKLIRRHVPAPISLQQLERVVLLEWENIPQTTIQNLITSLPRRMQAVIRARGGNTRY